MLTEKVPDEAVPRGAIDKDAPGTVPTVPNRAMVMSCTLSRLLIPGAAHTSSRVFHLSSSLLMSVSRILVARNAAGIARRNAVPSSAAHFTLVVCHRPHTLAPARFLHSTTPCWANESQRSSPEGPALIPSVPKDLPPDWQHSSYGFTLKTLPRVIFLMKLLGKTTESDIRALFTKNGHEV
jgi:hypothetical protein